MIRFRAVSTRMYGLSDAKRGVQLLLFPSLGLLWWQVGRIKHFGICFAWLNRAWRVGVTWAKEVAA